MSGGWRLPVAVVISALRALAAEPEPDGPSVCVPPCAATETCVGNACVAPGAHRPARPTTQTRPPESPATPDVAPTDAAPAVSAPGPKSAAPPAAPRGPELPLLEAAAP